MPTALVIDDRTKRLDWFQDHLEIIGFDVRLAPSGELALDQFHETAFDVAFFDHDLGDGINGSDLAGRVLRGRKYLIPKSVWVHSSNGPGSENIASKFVSAGIRTYLEDFEHFYEEPKHFELIVQALLTQADVPRSRGRLLLPRVV